MNLVPHTHEAFQSPAKAIETFADFVRVAEQLEAMRKTVLAVGLAAPQCGASVALFVTRLESFPTVFNPSFTLTSDRRTSRPEASVSRPGMSWFVPRYDLIHAEWWNAKGEFCQADLHGNDARVFQHMAQYLTGRQIWDL